MPVYTLSTIVTAATIGLSPDGGFSYRSTSASGMLVVHEDGTVIQVASHGDYSTAQFASPGAVLIGVEPPVVAL